MWHEAWVGLTWRFYRYERMRRVRAHVGTVGSVEGAEPRVVAPVAALGDVTESCGSEMLAGPDGKCMPARTGFGEVHPQCRRGCMLDRNLRRVWSDWRVYHMSGGAVTQVLLEVRVFSGAIADEVKQTMIDHLIDTRERSVAGKCLCDDDTLGANVGFPALFRQHSNVPVRARRVFRRPQRAVPRLASCRPANAFRLVSVRAKPCVD
jgi:hypothetical protein